MVEVPVTLRVTLPKITFAEEGTEKLPATFSIPVANPVIDPVPSKVRPPVPTFVLNPVLDQLAVPLMAYE